MKRLITTVLTSMLLLCRVLPAEAAPFTFDTIPAGGTVPAMPGDTVGWGYEITNTTPSLWLVLTSINASSFTHGVPDSSIFDFPIVGPGMTATQPYDPVNGLGLFQFTWDVGAFGFANSGTFDLSADVWPSDPSQGGSPIANLTLSAPYLTLTPAANPGGAVPEPGTLVGLATGLALLLRRRRAKASRGTPPAPPS
jgi:hypothetical protein